MAFFQELKRRNVFRMATAYVVTGWLLIEVAATLEETLFLPEWSDTLLAFFLILGFPVALFFSWVFEITPEGIKREKDIPLDDSARSHTASRLNRILVILMAVALAYFVVDKFLPGSAPGSTELTSARGSEAVSEEVDNSSPVSASSDLSIAVLPFVNMSSDSEQEYFSDGLTEELLNLLVRIDGLKVAARTSSFYYKDKLDEIPLIEIANQLGVAHILEGSVRRSGDQLRITAQLIESKGGFHLWSETWDRELNDIFAIQDEIAQAVADALHVTLVGAAPRSQVVNTRALELTLQGRFLFNRRAPGDMERALPLFEEAVAIDSNLADAWVGLAPLYLWLFNPPRIDDARAAVERAIELEPDNPAAWVRMGNVYYGEGESEKAKKAIEHALTIGPDDPLTLAMNASLRVGDNDLEGGIELLQHAVEIDPLHWVNRGFLINVLTTAGDLEAAKAQADSVLALHAPAAMLNNHLARIDLLEGRPEAVLARVESMEPPGPGFRSGDSRPMYAAMAHHDLGNTAASDEALAEYRDNYGDLEPMNVVTMYAWRGELDEAFQWLEKARDTGKLEYGRDYLFRAPELDSLREDPRWSELIATLDIDDPTQ